MIPYLIFQSFAPILGIVNIIMCKKYKVAKSGKYIILSLIIIIWQILGEWYWYILLLISDLGETMRNQPKILYIIHVIRIPVFPILAIIIFIILRKKIKHPQN